MSIVSRFASFFERKDHGLSSKEDRIFWSQFGTYGHKKFSKVPAALRAGFVLSGGIGMMPIRIEDGAGNEVLGSDVGDLLNVHPNDLMTGVEFRETLTLYAVFTGTGRAYIRRNSRGKAIELIPMHPSWSVAGWVLDKEGDWVLPVTVEGEGYLGEFKRDDILEITNPRWDLVAGMDTTASCQNVLGLSSSMQDRQAKLSDSNAPLGVITFQEGNSKDRAKRLKRQWAEQFGKTGVAMIDFEADFKQLMQSPGDQQLLETMKFNIEEVARLYGVHPYFLMQMDGNGAQNAVSDVMLFHQVHGMGPWISRWEAAIGRSLLQKTGLKAEFDETTLMRVTPEVRAEMYAKALGAGGNKPWMTENEVRSGKSPFRLAKHEEGNQLAHQKEVRNET